MNKKQKKAPRLYLYTISNSYLNSLNTVANIKESVGDKKIRPYIGVMFKVDGRDYFAPLGTPKTKHKYMDNWVDFHKVITHSKKNSSELIAVIDFNNMIPVPSSEANLVDIKKIQKKNPQRANLLLKEAIFINQNREILINKAKSLYDGYQHNTLYFKIKNRCLDFNALNHHYDQWISKTNVQVIPNIVQPNSNQSTPQKTSFRLPSNTKQTNKSKGHSR